MKAVKAKGKIIPKGWLKELLKRDAKGITGNLDKLFADAGLDVFGGKKVKHEEKGYWSSWWAGETRGNWMEAFIRLAFVTSNADFIARSREMVDGMLAHQEADGYLGIYLPEERYKITKRFGELWTQSRAMRSLICFYEYTGEERVLKALVRMADNILANVKTSVFEIADEDGSKGHSLMIIDGLAYLYSVTGNEKYRDFCVWMYEDYCAHASQFIQDDLRTGNVFDPAVPFVGHGPHTCEMLRLPLLLYEMTGEEKYLLAFRCGEKKLKKNLALSGSCKSDEFIGTYQSALVMESESRTGSFGGSVPLPSTGYEYCSTTELALDYLEAERVFGDLGYSDKLEWLVYNSALASKHPSGKMIQYLGGDNMYDASHTVNPRYDYSPTHDDAAVCCAPNACKLFPSFTEYAFAEKEGVLIANLYLPLSYTFGKDGEPMTIEEDTEYPFRYTVALKVRGKGSFPLALRIPAYAKRFSVTGSMGAYTVKGNVLYFEKEATGGDEITVEFFPEVNLLKAVDGTYALSYGTLLFSKDIPAVCKKHRKYEGAKGFYDCDFTPAPHTDWNDTLLVRGGAPEEAVIEYPEAKGYPLDEGAPVLSVRALDRYAYPVQLKLKPIGATTLRRTTFPVYEDTENIYKIR